MSLISGLYAGLFGVTLISAPEFFYGPSGLVPYFNIASAGTTPFFQRYFGACLLGLASGSLFDPNSKTVAKMNAIVHICILPLFIMNIMDDTGHWCLHQEHFYLAGFGPPSNYVPHVFCWL
jgi:hypothetical protein